MDTPLSAEQFIAICRNPAARQDHASASGCPYLLVELQPALAQLQRDELPQCPVIGWLDGTSDGNSGGKRDADTDHQLIEQQLDQQFDRQIRQQIDQAGANIVDLITSQPQQQALLAAQILAQPIASTTLIQVLRHNEQQSTVAGLLAESLAYSSLQHSRGFQRWLAQRDTKPVDDNNTPPAVLCQRQDDHLEISLNRPERHNAFNEVMKTELCELLLLAHTDNSITQVHLRGLGASFCAGGDLSEFGLAADAGLAHISRTTRHAGELLASLQCTTRATLHGACIGAGIEVPAFADHVSAHADSRFQLPEVAMGLIPGAGGTVSILQRIGRQRTALLAISNQTINARTALRWGLIDEIIEGNQ